MKLNIKKILFSFGLIFLFVSFSSVSAGVGNLSDAFKVDDGKVYAEKDRLDATAFNIGFNLGRIDDQGGATPEKIIAIIIQALLSLMGVVFIALIIFGGIQWMTASGNEQRIEKAQSIIKRAVVGLVIVLLAYIISYFVINIFVSRIPSQNF
ncbi:MAG: hypothetical protein WC928_03150 [Patescibacteria group bacterium]|jgi:hypothetical protein